MQTQEHCELVGGSCYEEAYRMKLNATVRMNTETGLTSLGFRLGRVNGILFQLANVASL